MTFGTTVGELYLIDTSALSRFHVPAVHKVISALIVEEMAATCVTVDLEVGYSGRNLEEMHATAESRRDLYRNLEMTEAIAQHAREVQLRMAGRGHHRAAGVIDLLTAAVAAHYRAVLLHYDSNFEHIAAVTGQPHLWIAPRGTLD
jgi:predicted nucleic acid-binding protein